MVIISATIKDVARKTGLSIATISKYINGGNVLDKNREIIQAAIEELNFTVNEMARGLKTNKTRTVGIALPDLNNLFFTSIVSKIEDVLLKDGYGTIICDYKQDYDLEKKKLEFLVNKSVDAIVLVPSGKEVNELRDILESGIPVILIDRLLKDIECDVVLGDNLNSSYNAVETLFTKGHKRVGVIVGPQEMYTAEQRLKGYYRVHEDYSFKIDSNLIKYGDYRMDSGYALFKELLSMDDPPTAVYVTNYEMTLGAVMAINEMGINIPDDLSIIGFDNMELIRVLNPPLSVVVQPMEKIGETTAKLLLKRMSGDNSNFPSINRLKSDLIVTKSIGKVK
ncbi:MULTISPECIES: LacI family DNA-binding transcriptional regulator [Clostridium]|uniref:LacI family transcriptional regulator n=1 Tax=Clostridium beijerinckii TaxID=1520 RepID=A0A1S9N2X3_CLOBE|nr:MULTISPECIES: LacI family DNA-binding transcriptional regulator [Clostridium]MBN7575789.1 LacI family DNA-binding transcriptional regulator [Clostridium beijerinckii]MBN7581211.1 LacI family DNA-binding transcriptional regulator [Clostridium beijerinckii]MBN7585798.1 LacI family DNA-binding transcriptional regulator [Clostridium beijerinckii]MBO0521410.1 LacI family DNA-binding transcriptional regulator [Clostridium beijerinckii]OOP71859.1 LacI family transcriptional regulator [Clostridium 